MVVRANLHRDNDPEITSDKPNGEGNFGRENVRVVENTDFQLLFRVEFSPRRRRQLAEKCPGRVKLQTREYRETNQWHTCGKVFKSRSK